MIKVISKFLALGLSLALVSACSDQYKIVSPGASEDEVNDFFDRVQANQTQAVGFNTTLADDLLAEPIAVYFTRSGTNGLTSESTFSMGDATPFTGRGNFAQEFQNVFEVGVSEVSIGFVDAISSLDNQRYFMLMLEFNYVGQDGYNPVYKAIAGEGSYGFTEDIFEVRFESQGTQGETIVLRTTDLDPDTSGLLGDNVQFQVHIIDGAGAEFPIGQFSTLAGFGS